MAFCRINKKLDKEKYILYNYKTVRSKAMKRILHFYIIYVDHLFVSGLFSCEIFPHAYTYNYLTKETEYYSEETICLRK